MRLLNLGISARVKICLPACPPCLSQSPRYTQSAHLASSQYSLYLPRNKSLTLQRNIKFQGVKIWNSVPLKIRKLTFNRFKIQYKKHLRSNYT